MSIQSVKHLENNEVCELPVTGLIINEMGRKSLSLWKRKIFYI